MNWAIELSKKHAPSGERANLFGVVVYTARHLNIKKVLRDQDYWDALHDISGPRWVVFATRARTGTTSASSLALGAFGDLIPVWNEPNENRELLQAFELSTTQSLPIIVVFAETEDGTVRKRVIRLDDSSEQAAYSTLKKVLNTVAEALEIVDDQNLQKETRAFDAVGYSITNYEEWVILQNGFKVLKWLRSQWKAL